MSALENDLKCWVLARLSQGFDIAVVAEALASEKVRLMQTSEYLDALPAFRARPIVEGEDE